MYSYAISYHVRATSIRSGGPQFLALYAGPRTWPTFQTNSAPGPKLGPRPRFADGRNGDRIADAIGRRRRRGSPAHHPTSSGVCLLESVISVIECVQRRAYHINYGHRTSHGTGQRTGPTSADPRDFSCESSERPLSPCYIPRYYLGISDARTAAMHEHESILPRNTRCLNVLCLSGAQISRCPLILVTTSRLQCRNYFVPTAQAWCVTTMSYRLHEYVPMALFQTLEHLDESCRKPASCRKTALFVRVLYASAQPPPQRIAGHAAPVDATRSLRAWTPTTLVEYARNSRYAWAIALSGGCPRLATP